MTSLHKFLTLNYKHWLLLAMKWCSFFTKYLPMFIVWNLEVFLCLMLWCLNIYSIIFYSISIETLSFICVKIKLLFLCNKNVADMIELNQNNLQLYKTFNFRCYLIYTQIPKYCSNKSEIYKTKILINFIKHKQK